MRYSKEAVCYTCGSMVPIANNHVDAVVEIVLTPMCTASKIKIYMVIYV